jgi:hypothetical protein
MAMLGEIEDNWEGKEMSYKRVIITGFGGLEVLKVVGGQLRGR